MLLTFKVLFLFLAVFFTYVNMLKLHVRQTIPLANLTWAAIGITGFITLQWLI